MGRWREERLSRRAGRTAECFFAATEQSARVSKIEVRGGRETQSATFTSAVRFARGGRESSQGGDETALDRDLERRACTLRLP